jgi:hypothetical protein
MDMGGQHWSERWGPRLVGTLAANAGRNFGANIGRNFGGQHGVRTAAGQLCAYCAECGGQRGGVGALGPTLVGSVGAKIGRKFGTLGRSATRDLAMTLNPVRSDPAPWPLALGPWPLDLGAQPWPLNLCPLDLGPWPSTLAPDLGPRPLATQEGCQPWHLAPRP